MLNQVVDFRTHHQGEGGSEEESHTHGDNEVGRSWLSSDDECERNHNGCEQDHIVDGKTDEFGLIKVGCSVACLVGKEGSGQDHQSVVAQKHAHKHDGVVTCTLQQQLITVGVIVGNLSFQRESGTPNKTHDNIGEGDETKEKKNESVVDHFQSHLSVTEYPPDAIGFCKEVSKHRNERHGQKPVAELAVGGIWFPGPHVSCGVATDRTEEDQLQEEG
mmetsp:Transcript_399/g.927  ORF Transcript_399/g.927 Transcript_399/m.927 type:complete len:218 (+) Transcript_399:297-950(+)